MKFVRLIVLMILIGIAFVFSHQPNAPSAPEEDALSGDQTQMETGVPGKAMEVLENIRRTGEAPAGYVGGRIFENREHRLPAGGDYREFDVDPHHGGRNAQRLVIEWRTKKAWYTGDHYRTFIPLP